MNAMLDPDLAERLAKLCGMFGSHHAGERAVAAAKADALIREHDLTWGEVLLAHPVGSTVEEMIAYAMRHGEGILSPWAESFLRGIRGRQFLTRKQQEKLHEIVNELASRRAAT